MGEGTSTDPFVRPVVAGARQTVDRIHHPKFGECFAVYDNGLACLVLDDGSVLDARIGLGGTNSEGSYRNVTLRGVTEKARLVAQGESHLRMWSPLLGLGWLVSERGPTFAMERFEPDVGTVLRFRFSKMSVGRPAYAKRLQRAGSSMPEMEPEERHWITYETSDGTVLAFRRNGPPPAEPEAPVAVAQPGLFGDVAPAKRRKRA